MRPAARDALGVLVILVAVCVYLSPALRHGGTFAPFDLAAHLSGLTASIAGPVHNRLDGDIVTQMVPWHTLDWRLVHAGQFPLWNDYEALGMPQFLNFESGVLSLPTVLSYLVPLRLAMLAAVAVKFALAGTGTYLFARVAGVRPPAAVFGGLTYMFSGPFSAWVGWSMDDVFALAGFVAAFALLSYRSRNPGYVVLLAVAVAFSVYAGFPEANILIAGAFAVAAAAGVAVVLAGRRKVGLPGAGRVAGGLLAGAGLSAPLWLPGLQIVQGAERLTEAAPRALGLHMLVVDLVPGYYGVPLNQTPAFGPVNYYESVGYVGLFALALAVTAVATMWRRPVVAGLAATAVVLVLTVYGVAGFDPVHKLASAVGAGSVGLGRSRTVLALVLAVLAAFGFEAVWAAMTPRPRLPGEQGRVARPDPPLEGPAIASDTAWARRVGDVLLGTALALAALVGLAAALGVARHLPADQHQARVAALLWPCVAAGGAIAAGALVWAATRTARARPRPLLVGAVTIVLLGGQTLYLVGTSAAFNSYSHEFFPSTPATRTYASAVGDGLVGMHGGNVGDVRAFTGLGFYPEVNIGYGVRQFAAHDPLIPSGYFDWPGSLPPPDPSVNIVVPDISSAAQARQYGIDFILAPTRAAAPPGTTFAAGFAGMALYRVPGASLVAFAAYAPGEHVGPVSHPDDRTFTATVDAPAQAVLVLHLTAVPGWHVTADGRALAVTVDGVMEQVTVPAGHHALRIWYWPDRLSVGILIAAVSAVLLGSWAVVAAGLAARRRSAP